MKASYRAHGLGGVWCYMFHPEPMWPVCGFYRCPDCLREYPVLWEVANGK